jgi:hypothetical protein
MSASDHVNRTLFHGTGHTFSEGETIDPQKNTKNGNQVGMLVDSSGKTKPRVYLTDSYDKAHNWSSRAAYDNDMLFAPVYEVEDQDSIKSAAKELEEHGYDENTTKVPWVRGTYSSTEPVKPKRIAGWAINPSIEYS